MPSSDPFQQPRNNLQNQNSNIGLSNSQIEASENKINEIKSKNKIKKLFLLFIPIFIIGILIILYFSLFAIAITNNQLKSETNKIESYAFQNGDYKTQIENQCIKISVEVQFGPNRSCQFIVHINAPISILGQVKSNAIKNGWYINKCISRLGKVCASDIYLYNKKYLGDNICKIVISPYLTDYAYTITCTKVITSF